MQPAHKSRTRRLCGGGLSGLGGFALPEGRGQRHPMSENPDAVPAPHWLAVEALPGASPGPAFPVRWRFAESVFPRGACPRGRNSRVRAREEAALPVPARYRAVCVTSGQKLAGDLEKDWFGVETQ
uniref:Uncharacterized protein n=1 Tax=Myotis myotis TaxID=51298 RepID=A0A7J7ZX24_MYOMY|nr:hypothetical protein mMyoMyo1_009706 [Myotis myotis]